MSKKITGVTKAAIAGAVFGTAVGMVAVPRTRKSKKRRRSSVSDKAGTALRTVGTAMQSVADVIER